MKGLIPRGRILAGTLTLAIVSILSTTATAQETTTGSISGRITDPQNLPLPGATVTVISPQGPHTFTSDDRGQFYAPFLTPGPYDVKIELTGFGPVERKSVEVRLGQRVELQFTLQVGGFTEAVVVEENTPVVDLSKSVVGTTLDSTFLNSVPVGRRFSDTLYLAPGVSSGGQVGQANPSIAGGSGLDNQYVLDGVNVTNAGYGALGSYSIVFGSLGSGVPFDFIKEEQIQTSGFTAEFGQSTGGVVNVITKSGSNVVRGSAFAYARPDKLESTYDQVQTVNGTVNVVGTRSSDAGLEVGGPIKKDQLFFFGAIDPQWERTTYVAPDGFPLQSLGDVDQNRHIAPYALKASYQASRTQRIDASFFGDPARGDNGPQRYDALLRTDTAGFSELQQYGGHNQSVKYDGTVGNGWLLEGAFSHAENNLVEVPSADQWSITDRTVTPNVHSGGIGYYEAASPGVNWQYQAKATRFLGPHEVRFGAQYEDISYDLTINRTGPTFALPDGTQTTTGAEIEIRSDPTYGEIYRVTRANTSNVRTTTQHYLTFFAQDTWKIGDRLTVSPGVRYEQQKLTGLLESLTLDNNWAPRIGATFDPMGKGKMKLYGNWGFYYMKVPNDLAARALSSDSGVSRVDYFDPALTEVVPDGTLAAGTTTHYIALGPSADQIDPNVKAGYMNEAIAGFEVEAYPGLNLGVRYIHRSIPRVLEDVQAFPVVAGDLGIPGATTAEYLLTNPGPDTPTSGDLGASFEQPVHTYDAVELVADRRLANRWSLQASYRWSRLRGTYEGFYRDDNGQSDPGITSLFDFPTNDPSYTAIGVPQFGYRGDIRYLGALGEGPLPLDRPQQIKAAGSYAFPVGVNVGASVQVGSGKPLTALAANPSYSNAGEIPEGVRGSGFDTVDGFRTRTRFEYTTALHADWGVKVGPRRIVLLADAFNLFDRQDPLDYDPNTETTFGVLNPDLGTASRFNLAQLQTPRQIRVGVRFQF